MELGHMCDTVAGSCLALRTRMLARRLTRLYDDALRRHGLTVSQLILLVAMTRYPDKPAAVLGRGLEIEKSTLSRNLARLAEAGWITQAPLSVTDAGRALIAAAYPDWQRAQREAEHLVGEPGRAALHTLASTKKGAAS
jgi:DNA-binding MarR family transcriptional regulator